MHHSLRKFFNYRLFKSIGPGFIIASVVVGPGSITVSSRIGSEYGNSFLWVIVLSSIFMAVYTVMAARFGVVSKETFLNAIAIKYGRTIAVLMGISSFIAAASFQFGNNLGIGIGMEGITGIPELVWPFIFTPLAISLVLWAKNVYKLLEKLMLSMVMIMIGSFLVNLFFIRPELTAVLSGFIPSGIPSGSFNEIAAIIATTFVLNGAIFQAYLVRDRGWSVSEYRQSIHDSITGIFMLGLISMLVIVTSAAALFPEHITVNSAADMARQLELLFGPLAQYIFSLGLCAAAFSSLVVNGIIGGRLLADSLGMGASMETKATKISVSVVLLIGMLVAVFFKGNVILALITAQAASIFGVPLIAVAMLVLLNNRDIMGTYINTKWQNVLAGFGFLLIIVIVWFMAQRVIGFVQNI